MREKNKTKWYILLLVILLISAGFFREFLFVNINYQIHHVYYHTEQSHASDLLSFLDEFSYKQLFITKWILTFSFVALFTALSGFLINSVFNSRKLVIYTVLVFAVLSFTAGIFYLGGLLLNEPAKGYTLARAILGWIQSPFIVMVLVPAFRLKGGTVQ